MKLRIDSGVHNIDLGPYARYTRSQWLTEPAGREHYKLLAYLSSQLPAGSKVADLGTFEGASALALAYNPAVSVMTMDTEDRAVPRVPQLGKIAFCKGNCLDHVQSFIDASLVMLDVDPHDGKQEAVLIHLLKSEGFDGLLTMDDINLNDGMRSLWNNILLKKIDVTRYGHWSGTGVVVFNPDTIDVKVE